MDNPISLVELTARVWPRYFRSGAANTSGTRLLSKSRVRIVGGVTYKGVATVRSVAGNGTCSVAVFFYDVNNVDLGSPLTVASSVTPGASWTDYSATVAPASIPAGAVTMAVFVRLNNASTTGVHEIKQAAIEDNAVAGVPLSVDPYMRDLNAWTLAAGTAAEQREDVDATPQSLQLRYATAAYVTAAGDTPARTPYEARVINPGTVRSEIPVDMGGLIVSNFGEIVLNNSDGALTELAYAGLSGVEVTVLTGSQTAARSTFSTAIKATVEQATVDHRIVRLRLRGSDAMLARPILPNRYAGTNALPAGLEGTADDIGGLPKPRIFGAARNFAPPCVNTSRLIYQVHDCLASRDPHNTTESVAITAVRVRGLALTQGADYTDQTDMETNAPAAGAFRAWPGGGYFRLGTAAAGLVTCDAYRTQGSPGEPRGLGHMVAEIATDAGITALKSGTSGIAGAGNSGLWVSGDDSIESVLRRLILSSGHVGGFAAWGGLPGAQFEFGLQQYPRDTLGYEWCEFDTSSILSLKGMPSPLAGGGMPFWRVDLSYAQNHSPITTDIDSGVSQADRAKLAAHSKRVQSSVAATQTMHPAAGTLLRETLLDDDEAAAQLEADRVLAAVKRAKPCFELVVALDAAEVQSVKPRLGGLVRVTHSALWSIVYTGERRSFIECLILAIEVDLGKRTLRMTALQSPDDY